MNKTLTLLIAAIGSLFVVACHNEKEEIISQWEDGTPQLVRKYRGTEEHKIKTAEIRYYANGKKQYEKYYKGENSEPHGTWTYYYENGATFASAEFDHNNPLGMNWSFLDPTGKDFFTGSCDSVRVLELNDYETPATVCFYNDSCLNMFQFYSTCTLRSQGKIVNGKREGVWQFFFSNGQPQTEATFVDGKEEGTYIVYRENGIPFYRGQYKAGKRTGEWEVYDEEANLVATQTY